MELSRYAISVLPHSGFAPRGANIAADRDIVTVTIDPLPAGVACAGDINGECTVNFNDLVALNADYFTACPRDGAVNMDIAPLFNACHCVGPEGGNNNISITEDEL